MYCLYRIKRLSYKFILASLFSIFSRKKYFKIAISDAEKLAIFKFRYQVYHNHYGRDVAGIDHKNKIICDEYDLSNNAILVYQGDINNITCVMRYLIWDKKTLPEKIKHDYDFDKLKWVDNFVVAEIGRLMEKPDTKKNKLNSIKIIASSLRYIKKQFNVGIFIASCKPGLVVNYCEMGIVPYTDKIIEYPDGIEVPLMAFPCPSFLKKFKGSCIYLFDNSTTPKVEHIKSIFKNLAVITNKKLVNQAVTNFYQTKSNSNFLPSKELMTLFVKHGAYIMHINQLTKLTHKNALEFDIYFLLSGNAYIRLDNNDEFSLETASFLGESSYLLPNNRRLHNIYTEKSELLVIRRSTLKAIHKKHTKQYIELLTILTRQLQAKYQQTLLLEAGKFKPVAKKNFKDIFLASRHS